MSEKSCLCNFLLAASLEDSDLHHSKLNAWMDFMLQGGVMQGFIIGTSENNCMSGKALTGLCLLCNSTSREDQ